MEGYPTARVPGIGGRTRRRAGRPHRGLRLRRLQLDRVVEESLIGIELSGLFVGPEGGERLAGLELQIPDPVVEPRILGPSFAGGFRSPDGLEIDLDGAPPVLLLLELAGRFLEPV